MSADFQYPDSLANLVFPDACGCDMQLEINCGDDGQDDDPAFAYRAVVDVR